MLVGPGGNVTVQVGPQGVLLVDTMFGPAGAENHGRDPQAFKRAGADTSSTRMCIPDHVGGNEAIVKLLPPDPSQPLTSSRTKMFSTA